MLPAKNYITIALNIILSKHFSPTNCLNFIYDADFIDINVMQPFLTYNVSRADLHSAFHRIGCHGMVLYTKRPKMLLDLVETIIRFTPTTKFHERRYIVMHADGYEDDVFSSTNLEFVADFVIGVEAKDGIEFRTNQFVGLEDHSRPVFVDKWFIANESFMLNGEDMYRDKLTNMEGRRFRISTFDYKPYMNIETEHGIELMMAKEYARLHNMTVYIINEEVPWGEFFENNYTANGAQGTVITDKADISMGAWYRLQEHAKYFDLTETTVGFAVTFLVPVPRLASRWLTPIIAFSKPLWLGFVTTTFGACISLIAYNYLYQRYIQTKVNINFKEVIARSIILNFVTLFFQQSTRYRITIIYLRAIYVNLMILGVFFFMVYSAGLSAIMTMPKYEQGIKDTIEFDASDLKWGALHMSFLLGFQDLAKYQNIVKNVIVLDRKGMRYYMHQQTFAMLVDRVPNGLALGTSIDANDIQYYQLLADDVYSDFYNGIVKKSSVFSPTINHAYLSMKEVGLLYFWEMQALFEENYAAQIAFKAKDKSVLKIKLSFRHLEGIFGVLWIGLLIAFLIFIYELKCRK